MPAHSGRVSASGRLLSATGQRLSNGTFQLFLRLTKLKKAIE